MAAIKGIWIAILLIAMPLHAEPSGDSSRDQSGTQQRGEPSSQSPEGGALNGIIDELEKTRIEQRDSYSDERNERERRDIVAQEKMADWAEPMFWAMVAQTILALGALTALLCDLKQNRKTAYWQLRPYVHFVLQPRERKDQPLKSGVVYEHPIKNYGQTPAFNVRTYTGYEVAERPLGNVDPPLDDEPGIFGTLPPGETMYDPIKIGLVEGFDNLIAHIQNGYVLVVKHRLVYDLPDRTESDHEEIIYAMDADGMKTGSFFTLSDYERSRTS